MVNLKNILFISLALMIFLNLGSCFEIDDHDITIVLFEDGGAKVTEIFRVSLNESEKQIFDKISLLKESTLEDWKELSENIHTYVLGTNVSIKSISAEALSGGQFGYRITILYQMDKLCEITSGKGRIITYTLNGEKFYFYNSYLKKMIIPKNTRIIIYFGELKNYKINSISPNPYQQFKDQLFWVGPASLTNFYLEFSVEKSISQTWKLENIVDYFLSHPLYLITLGIIVVLVITYRKRIVEVIIESFKSEEES
ncbi:MAG: hypothetical protein QW097_00575 [archaeon]